MSLMPWTPFLDPFEEMDTIGNFIPAIDMYKTKNSVVVEVSVPKFDPKDIRVTVENDVLILEGQTSHKREVDEKNYYRKEMRSGSFYRSLALPGRVDGEKTRATYDNGILRVEVPFLISEKKKSVPVEVKAIKDLEKK